MQPTHSVIVGDQDDPHVAAVLELLPKAGLVVFSAATVTQVMLRYEIGSSHVLRDLLGEPCELVSDDPPTGWFRRAGPDGWSDGVTLGGREAASAAASLALLFALLRSTPIRWITPPDALARAENKLIQYAEAAKLEFLFPATLIPLDSASLSGLGESFVLKPLGPGAFRSNAGEQLVVHATATRGELLQNVDLRRSPFIAQTRLEAELHLRIVTVDERHWVFCLQVDDELPLDWRSDARAHNSFVATEQFTECGKAAVALARSLSCGYSSQDWIVANGVPHFLDLNPSGQWLFLPKPAASQVTDGLAARLR